MPNDETNVTEQKDCDVEILPVYKCSPTCYHDTMALEIANQKQYCRISDIRKMIERNQLTENDIVILKVLFKYEFLTRYTLSLLIGQMNEEVPKRANYKNALSKLVKNGIILRYYMTWDDCGATRATPCFYSLTNGAREYVKKVYSLTDNAALLRMFARKEISITDVLQTASVNQYHAVMLKHYSERILQTFHWLDVSANKQTVCVPCVHRYKTHIFGSGHLDIVGIPVRSCEGQDKTLLQLMNCVADYVKKPAAIFDNPLFILICENGEHAYQMELYLNKHLQRKLLYLYLLDRNIIKDAPLDYLFSVSMCENGYSLEVQKLNIL